MLLSGRAGSVVSTLKPKFAAAVAGGPAHYLLRVPRGKRSTNVAARVAVWLMILAHGIRIGSFAGEAGRFGGELVASAMKMDLSSMGSVARFMSAGQVLETRSE